MSVCCPPPPACGQWQPGAMKGLQWLLTHHLFAIPLARPRWVCTVSPTSQLRKLPRMPKSSTRVPPAPSAALTIKA